MTEIYFAKATDGLELRKHYRVANDIATEVKADRFAAAFTYERRDPADLREFATLLKKVVEYPKWAVVMGRPLIKTGPRQAIYFEDYPTSFWIIDLDGVPIEGTTEETIIRCLPFLRGHEYVYYYSQSAKMKDDGLRVRVICHVEPMTFPEFIAYPARVIGAGGNCACRNFTGTVWLAIKAMTPEHLGDLQGHSLLGLPMQLQPTPQYHWERFGFGELMFTLK